MTIRPAILVRARKKKDDNLGNFDADNVDGNEDIFDKASVGFTRMMPTPTRTTLSLDSTSRPSINMINNKGKARITRPPSTVKD